MIFNRLMPLNELDINGQHVDNEDDGDDYITDAPTQQPDDNAEEETPDDAPIEDESDDYTDYQMQDELTDQSDGETENTPDDNDDTSDEGGDNDLEDFTQDTPDDNDDTSDEGGDDDTSDEGGDDDKQKPQPASDNQQAADDTNENPKSLESMEKVLFQDLNPQQMAIKNAELLQNYSDMYEALTIIFDNINKLPKTYENTRIIEFIGNKILDLKDMVNTIIITTYPSRSYIENLTEYKKCLLLMQQINTMLEGLKKKPEESNIKANKAKLDNFYKTI